MSGGELTQIFEEVMAARQGGPAVVLATVIQSPPDAPVSVSAKLLLRQDGSSLGSLGGGPLEAAILADAREALRRHAVAATRGSTPRRPGSAHAGAPGRQLLRHHRRGLR